ncbi:MAG: SDR family oxidoreductase [Flavobacteriaceae bacterium]
MILVTGGTGLVGSHLLYSLTLLDVKIRAIHRNKSNINAVKNVFSYYTDDFEKLFKKIEWLEADVTDVPSLEKAYKDVTIVYHCAAIVSFDKRNYKKMRQINIEGTANMVNFAISQKIDKFCFVSSIATIEKNLTNKPIDETNEWNTETNNYGYAITKYGAEMEVWRATQEGLQVVIVNPGVILGSGFWHNGPGELFTKFYNEFKFYTEGVTGFVGVKDVVKAMIQLMQSDVVNERFILVSKSTSFKNLFFLIADAFGKKRPTIKVGKILSNIAWRFEWLKCLITKKSPLITKHSASASLSSYTYSSDKIKKTIGFEFESFDNTVTDVCGDYLKG